MVLPLVPLISLAMVANGGDYGAWYGSLTPRQNEEAKLLAQQAIKNWFGAIPAARLTRDQAAKVLGYVSDRFRPEA